MLLDRETFDLVQHIDTVLAATVGHEYEPRVNAELMQSVLEIATPICRTAADVETELRKLRAFVCGIAHDQGLRVGSAGTHPFSLFERQQITAKDRYRQLVDQLQYVARRELIFGMHIHVAVERSREGDPGRERPARPPLAAARPLGLVAVLARRADRPGLEPADGLRGVPPLGPAAALPQLRRLRRGDRPAREDGLHCRLHAHLVGRAPAPAARHGRDPDLRRGHADRGRRRARGLLPVARQALLRAVRQRRRDPLVPPHPHEREQVARRALRARGAGDGPRHGTAQPRPRRAADPPHAAGRSSRTRASSAASGSSRGSRRSWRRATAPTGSSASSMRTGTSTRSSPRSRTRPRSRRRRPRDRLGPCSAWGSACRPRRCG